MNELIRCGLMPSEEAERKALEKLDPYWLRAAALREKLPLPEIGRAIFHLNQRRGFKSNRITDADDAEGSAMKEGMAKLTRALEAANAGTLGEFLANRHLRDKHGNRVDAQGRPVGRNNGGAHMPDATGVRFRPHSEGAKNVYDFYPTRQMIEHELGAIWSAQAKHHPELTGERLARLKTIILAQRPLKKPPVGRCTFRSDEQRAPRALPLFQRFRILTEIANLEIERPGFAARKLSLQDRDALAALLASQSSVVSFDKMHRAIKLRDDESFNLEAGGRKGLDADKTAAVLAKTGKGESFGKSWRSLPRERQSEIVDRLLGEADEDALIDWLRDECSLDEIKARAASAARLPDGHGHIGRSMLIDLLDVMETESAEACDPSTGELYRRPLTYDEAVIRLGLHHSNLDKGRYARLPYYGTALPRHVIANPNAPEGSQEWIGRVPNPTVHIALNQLRAVINALIDEYGKPAEIRIELARELKQNRQQKDEASRRNRENESANEKRRDILAGLGYADTPGNRLMLRLYDELPADERVCIYSGKPISMEMLFSGGVDIDHILPRSKTLDDGFMNKVLCTLEMNRRKGNRPPADAFSGDELRDIGERAKRLFPKKAWRFAPDAMEKFAAENDFIARHLTDSQHMARLAKYYLGQLFGEEANSRVFASPGRLTSMLRGMWGLNALLRDHNRRGGEDERASKNRDDHRHHLLDAFVIACTDRGLLQRVATAAGRAEDHDLARWSVKGEFPDPFDGFREQLGDFLRRTVVSHKLDHGLGRSRDRKPGATSGKLHDATAYGRADDEIGGKRYNLVSRKALAGLKESEIGRIRDARLREALEEVAYVAKRDGIKLADALAHYGERTGIRRVRVLETRQDAYTRTIRHGGGRFEKTYLPADNHCLDLFEADDGTWDGAAVTVFDANQKDFRPAWMNREPRPRRLMRLHKGDLVQADFGEGRDIWRVVRLEPSAKRVRLVLHHEAGNYEQRHNDPDDPFRWNFATYQRLKDAGARPVRVDPIGRVETLPERPAP